LETLNAEIATLEEQVKDLRAKWEGERGVLAEIQKLKQEKEQLNFTAERLEREGDYGKVAEIRYSALPALDQRLEQLTSDLKARQGAEAMVKEVVTADDIADIVSRWTGIPVTRMLQSERERLLHLDAELHQRVIGQEEAVTAIANAVLRSRAGLQDPKRPIGSFIFLGTTGVGKTEVARALAELLFNDEQMMTRIDMSEYQEKHSVSRLVGAPPGYVGYDEGGQLTEAVRRKPYSVVLFDEIEKAHPDVFNILLQVLDDGRLTDNKGRTVNFKNTIIIMTSNLGSAHIQARFDAAREVGTTNDDFFAHEGDTLKDEVMGMLKQTIRPEFLNRVDDIILFHPLSESDIKEIVRLQVDQIRHRLAEQQVTLTLTEQALELIAHEGYDPHFGARPVKRALQRMLLNRLSHDILAGTVSKDLPIQVDANGDELLITNGMAQSQART
ncbi:MAG: AAA family ATPase, partial [Bacteroidaceae bacterium]|nr:AAA family ATPase [Bacteroidaceae bacterium]